MSVVGQVPEHQSSSPEVFESAARRFGGLVTSVGAGEVGQNILGSSHTTNTPTPTPR